MKPIQIKLTFAKVTVNKQACRVWLYNRAYDVGRGRYFKTLRARLRRLMTLWADRLGGIERIGSQSFPNENGVWVREEIDNTKGLSRREVKAMLELLKRDDVKWLKDKPAGYKDVV